MARPGAFAELVAIPDRNLIPVPDGMKLEHAALMEPAGVAVHAVHLAERAARPAAERGDGLCDRCRADRALGRPRAAQPGVAAPSRSPTPTRCGGQTAAVSGCAEVIDPRAGGGPAESSCDVVIDAVGSEATRNAAIAAVRPGGVVIHVGLMQDGGTLDVRKITATGGEFLGLLHLQ